MASWFDDLIGGDSGSLWGPIIGGVLGGIGGGASEAGQTTTTQAPWGPAQPYILDYLNMAKGESQYGGALTQDQIDAQKELGRFASGEYANPLLGVDNPYLQQVIDNSSADAMRNLQPMINKANAASGAFGNSGVAEAYGRNAADVLGNIATKTRYTDYLNQQDLNERDMNRRVGVALPAFMGQANYAQDLPWQNIQKYQKSVTGTGGSSTSQPYFTNTLNNVLGGAGLGAALTGWGR